LHLASFFNLAHNSLLSTYFILFIPLIYRVERCILSFIFASVPESIKNRKDVLLLCFVREEGMCVVDFNVLFF